MTFYTNSRPEPPHGGYRPRYGLRTPRITVPHSPMCAWYTSSMAPVLSRPAARLSSAEDSRCRACSGPSAAPIPSLPSAATASAANSPTIGSPVPHEFYNHVAHSQRRHASTCLINRVIGRVRCPEYGRGHLKKSVIHAPEGHEHLIADGLHDHAPPALIIGTSGARSMPLICILSIIHTP